MQQLCNKLSDHTFKIEKGKHKQQQKKSEKTRDFIFSPFFLVVVPLSTPEPFLAGCLWRLITIKALALFICLVQRMAKDIIARR